MTVRDRSGDQWHNVIRTRASGAMKIEVQEAEYNVHRGEPGLRSEKYGRYGRHRRARDEAVGKHMSLRPASAGSACKMPLLVRSACAVTVLSERSLFFVRGSA